MLNIGDNILYGAGGVMTIVDVREEVVGSINRSYYVLRPARGRSESLTFVPVDNERLVSSMHPLLREDEIYALLDSLGNLPSIEWVPENRARQEYFKRVMESCDRAMIFAMIAAIDENGRRREAEGKKNFLSDENARAKAQRLLYSEFSIVLGISEEQVAALVLEKMN